MKNLIRVKEFLFLMAIAYCTMSCKKADLAVLNTDVISEVGMTKATGGGTITSDGGVDISARGVCWAETDNPTTADSKTSDGSGSGSFQSHLTGLKPGTTYYLSAYAINSAGTSYGSSISFTTFDVEDADGNGYNTVVIGTQVWLKQNLKTTHFQNGDAISRVSSDAEWSNSTGPSYCYYNNDLSKASEYGNLYNFYTVEDSRNVCPTGWRVSSMDDWIVLMRTLGDEFTADVKIREAGTSHWVKDVGADNSTGFTFLPGGNRESDGKYFNLYSRGNLWTSTIWIENGISAGWLVGLEWDRPQIRTCPYSKPYGASIRCIKN